MVQKIFLHIGDRLNKISVTINMRYQQVSFIKDLLPELSDVENNTYDKSSYDATMINNTQRSAPIRNKMMAEPSGMTNPPNQPPLPASMQFQTAPQFPPYYHNQPQNVIPIAPNPEDNGVIENYASHCDCRSVYDHIIACPICKKFYVNDNTIYLIIIAILVVACALLLKRILRV